MTQIYWPNLADSTVTAVYNLNSIRLVSANNYFMMPRCSEYQASSLSSHCSVVSDCCFSTLQHVTHSLTPTKEQHY